MTLISFLRNAAPFAAMVFVECGEVAMTTLTKAAMNEGIGSYVYVSYYTSLGVLILLPSFILQILRKRILPITSALLCRCFILGLLGRCLLMLAYVGLDYGSPALAAALANLTPVFTFLFALIFRMEKIELRNPSSQAKSLGTIITVSGAFILTLYRGPKLFHEYSSTGLPHHHLLLFLSRQSNWVLGGLFMALGYLFSAAWNVLQSDTVNEYPDKITVVFFFLLFGAIQCVVFSFAVERNLNAWILHHNIELIAIFYSAFFGTAIRYHVLTWCLNEKGPLYVSLFKPLGMIIAEIAGIIFLGDTFHLGSLVGGIIISIGFYVVMWGKAEEEHQTGKESKMESSTQTQRTPLLQNNSSDDESVIA